MNIHSMSIPLLGIVLSRILYAEEPLKPMAVGVQAPDITATGIDGEPFKLSELQRKRERHLVLIFSRANW